jgi:uncharacterized protein YxjI
LFLLKNNGKVLVHQKFELGELIGFETRNKYEILDQNLQLIGFAAEQGKGGFKLLLRQFLGHWRTFEILFFNEKRQPLLKAIHPFRWYFERLDVEDMQKRPLGSIEKRFSLFHKCFDVIGNDGRVLFEVRSPIWKIWTFVFRRGFQEKAVVSKKWSGLLSESFTDKDKFLVDFQDPSLSDQERNLLLVAAVYIDLIYFEKKAGDD